MQTLLKLNVHFLIKRKNIALAVILAICCIYSQNIFSQACPQITTFNGTPTPDCGGGICELCPFDMINFQVTGIDLPQGTVDWFIDDNPSFNPAFNQGEYIGESLISPNPNTQVVDECNPCPQLLALMVDACNFSGQESNNEFFIISSGGGISSADQIQFDFAPTNNGQGVMNNDINMGNDPCEFLPQPNPTLIAGLLSTANCDGTNIIGAGPSTPIPAGALVVVFTSSNLNVNYDFDGLCANGETIYVLQSDCPRSKGAFTNSQGNGIRRQFLFIGDCPQCQDELTYDTDDVTNISGGSQGTYVFVNIDGNVQANLNVPCTAPPVETIPIPPIPSIIDDYAYIIPFDLCDPSGPKQYYIRGVVNPMYDGCPEALTDVFTFIVNCIEPDLGIAPPLCVGQDPVILDDLLSDNSIAGISGWFLNGSNITEFEPTSTGSFEIEFFPPFGGTTCYDSSSIVINVTDGIVPELQTTALCGLNGVLDLNTLEDTSFPDGNWSGDGVDGETFNPAGLSGEVELTFSPTNSECGIDAVTMVTVTEPDSALLMSQSICQGDATLNLIDIIDASNSTTTTGTWEVGGVSSDDTFDPAGLEGDFIITFTPDESCSIATEATINVAVAAAPILDTPSICESAEEINLEDLFTDAPITGTGTGDGVTDGMFDPSTLDGEITLDFEAENNCVPAASTTITVMQEEEPTLVEPANICENGTALDLSTLLDTNFPTGTWTGDGVATDMFDPANQSGDIILTFESDESCVADATVTISIDELTSPTLIQPTSLCEIEDAISLDQFVDTNFPTGTWAGDGVTGNMFDPNGLSGSIELTFTSDEDCTEITNTNITVTGALEPTISQPDPLCENDSELSLDAFSDANYPNGTWTGDGVTNELFNPDGLSGDIVLTFTPNEDCVDIATTTITIQELQTPNLIEPSAVCNSADEIDLNTFVDTNFPNGTWSGDGVTGNIQIMQ